MPWSMPLPPMQPMRDDIDMGRMQDFDRRIHHGGDDAGRPALEYALTVAARWIPVGERLPEMGETVMVAHSKDGWVGTGERVLTGAYLHWADDGEELHDPTHWMPLPAPPTDAK